MNAQPAGSPLFRIVCLATGGTIEKSYDARRGELSLDVPVLEDLLASLAHPDISIQVMRVMARDSLDMDDADRARIASVAEQVLAADAPDALIVTHGTDTLAATAATLAAALVPLRVPVLLTGAMRPYRVADSDAAQNVAQAILAASLVGPGVYAVFHGRVIPADRIVKDYDRMTFVDRPG